MAQSSSFCSLVCQEMQAFKPNVVKNVEHTYLDNKNAILKTESLQKHRMYILTNILILIIRQEAKRYTLRVPV